MSTTNVYVGEIVIESYDGRRRVKKTIVRCIIHDLKAFNAHARYLKKEPVAYVKLLRVS